jgi:ferredoxin, 2Fe-2S
LLRPVHRVSVEPHGIELEVKDGQTVFRVANEHGLKWPTRCGGARTCTLCTMIILDGAENLSRPDAEESFLVAPIARRAGVEPARIRMACAAKVKGRLVVRPRYRFGATGEDEEPA